MAPQSLLGLVMALTSGLREGKENFGLRDTTLSHDSPFHPLSESEEWERFPFGEVQRRHYSRLAREGAVAQQAHYVFVLGVDSPP